MKAKLGDSGITTAPLNGADLRAFVKPQAALYRDIITSARISVD